MSLSVRSRHVPSSAEEAIAALTGFMRSCEADRLLLLTIVTGGYTKFVNVLRAECRGLPVDDLMIGRVWRWLEYRKGPNPEVEREWLEIQARDQRWHGEAERACLARLETAARYNLRLKGDQLFDGEKVTVGEDDPRL